MLLLSNIMPGVKGNCAVVSCNNSSSKLDKWKKDKRSGHDLSHEECPCQPPFKLFFFPSNVRNAEWRMRCVQKMKREDKNKTKWGPCNSDDD